MKILQIKPKLILGVLINMNNGQHIKNITQARELRGR